MHMSIFSMIEHVVFSHVLLPIFPAPLPFHALSPACENIAIFLDYSLYLQKIL